MRMKLKIHQLKSGVFLTYCTQGVHILTGLLYTPIMLRLLGQSEYGLYQLVSSVVSYLSLLSLGFSTGYIRFYSRYKIQDDEKGIAKLNGMYAVIFTVIAIVCLLCGGVMVWRADLVFGTGLSAAELEKAKILMAMMVLNLAITFLNSVFSSHISAQEKFFFLKLVEFFRALLNPFMALPLLILGYGSVGMVAVTSFLTVFSFALNIFYARKKLQMQFDFSKFDFKLFREMGAFTFFIFINMVTDQINWSVDKFLLGRMMGTVAVAVYGVASQLNTMYLSLSTAVSSVFVPRVNRLAIQESKEDELIRLFSRVGRIQFLILALVLSGYAVFGREFIRLWAGDGYEEAYRIGLILMTPVTVPLIQNIGIEIQRARNLHKARSVVYLLIAVGNVFVSIPLIRICGGTGAALGTAICLILGNVLFMNFYYRYKMKLDMGFFWKEIGKLIPPIAIAAALGFTVTHFVPCSGWVELFVYIAVYVLVYAALVWLFGMDTSEKDLVRVPLGKIRRLLCRK